MANSVPFTISSELFEFDWCQCPMPVFLKMKDNEVLSSFLWGQNKFLIIGLEDATEEQVQQSILSFKALYPDKYMIVTCTKNHSNFFSNNEFSILNHMISIGLLNRNIHKTRLSVSKTRDTFFTVFKGNSVVSQVNRVEIVNATVPDLYQMYAASNAPSHEYVDNVNECYFAEDYNELIARLKAHKMLVVKYMNQVFGFLEYSVKPFEVNLVNNLETQKLYDMYVRHGIEMVADSMTSSLKVCYVHFTCSFTRWGRLLQDRAVWGSGKMMWNKLVDRITSLFPNTYTLIYNESMENAIDFHERNGMLLNENVPLLQFLQMETDPGVIEGMIPAGNEQLFNYMYYVATGKNLVKPAEPPLKRARTSDVEEKKLEGGRARTNPNKSRSRKKRRSPIRSRKRRSPKRSRGKRSPRRSPRRSRERRSPRRSPRRSRERRSPRRSPKRSRRTYKR